MKHNMIPHTPRLRYRALIALLLTALLGSCDTFRQEITNLLGREVIDTELSVTRQVFSPGNDSLTMEIDIAPDCAAPILTDTNAVSVNVTTSIHDVGVLRTERPLDILSFRYVAAQKMLDEGVIMFALVDLTLSPDLIALQRNYVSVLSRVFCHDNLYIAFMLPEGQTTQIMPATEYVINNYISQVSPLTDKKTYDLPYSFLYKSIVDVIRQMHLTGKDYSQSRHKALAVFSNGMVYDPQDADIPLDYDHYQHQIELITKAAQLENTTTRIFCVLLEDENTSVSDIEGANIMRLVAEKSGGKYYETFTSRTIMKIIQAMDITFNDYVMTVRIPQGRYFIGERNELQLLFTDKNDSTRYTATATFDKGSIDEPIIVGRPPYYYTVIVLRGTIFGIILLMLAYLAMQIVEPWLRYLQFRRKYTGPYTGPQMTLQGNTVGTTCYHCKGRFVKGEMIVARCKHPMHLSCWEENGQKCTEHGAQCPHGAHYYNRSNLLDPRNALYHQKWLMLAGVAGLLSYLLAFLFPGFFSIVVRLVPTSFVDYDTMMQTGYMRSGALQMISLSLILTFMLSLLTTHRGKLATRAANIAARCLGAMLAVSLLYVVYNILARLLPNIDSGTYGWAFASLSMLVITASSTLHTRVRQNYRHHLMAAASAGVVALVSNLFVDMYFVESISSVSIVQMLMSIAASVFIAQRMPDNDHAFLRIAAPIKQMDIALYKWLRSAPDVRVTIGRSVDCHIHITWDAKADLAPIHADIRLHGLRPYLHPHEDGITMLRGKQVRKPTPLYHGDRITIGLTEFIYIEN